MKTTPRWLTLSLSAFALTPFALQAELFQAPFGPGGTWNVYETGSAGATFESALTNAKSRKFDPITGTVNASGTVAGNLPDILSQGENTFINRTIQTGDSWIGLTDREGWAPGASEGNFRWTSGQPVGYTNWGGGEPNNAGAGEDAGQLSGGGTWNDNGAGSGGESSPTFGYAIEYATSSPLPYSGIRIGSALPAAGTLPGAIGSGGQWSVREVQGVGGVGNILQAVDVLRGSTGTVKTGQFATLNTTDPQTNAGGGPMLSTAPNAFLSNTAADDNDIVSSAKGKIRVTEAGTYTFQVRSDDGFALRVVGAQFDSVNGAGYLDPVDRSTMVFNAGTGDSNTRGVITLAAGAYDVEFVHWEGGGGAFYEVTHTKGSVSDPAAAQWLALGDGSTVQTKHSETVFLTGAATVSNTPYTAVDPKLSNAITAINAAIGGGTARTGTTNTVAVADGQMPIERDGVAIDNYATKVTGSIALNDHDATAGESQIVTFHVASDDGALLRIVGQDFINVTDFTGDGDATKLNFEGDDSISADYWTGNTNAFGSIQLKEGETYNFELYQYEGGGGSNVNIWYALGDHTVTGWNEALFRRLTLDQILQGFTGIGMVPEPSTALFGLASLGLLARRRRQK